MKTFKQHLEEQTKLRGSETDTGDRSYDSIENIRAGAAVGIPATAPFAAQAVRSPAVTGNDKGAQGSARSQISHPKLLNVDIGQYTTANKVVSSGHEATVNYAIDKHNQRKNQEAEARVKASMPELFDKNTPSESIPDTPYKSSNLQDIQREEKRKQENKDNLERNSVANTLKLASRVLGPGESWGDGYVVNRHDQALTIATGFTPNGGPGSFPSLRQQMTAEKIWDTDIGLAYDLDDDGAVMADQAGMKALQNRRKIGKSVYFKKETPTEYIKHIFSGKGIKDPYDD